MKVFNRPIKLGGHEREINGVTVQVLQYDGDGNILLCTGTTVPAADSEGFSKGGLFIKTDAADGTKGLYENEGTSSLSDFSVAGLGDATVSSDGMNDDPETDTEAGYITIDVGGTDYEIPFYASS